MRDGFLPPYTGDSVGATMTKVHRACTQKCWQTFLITMALAAVAYAQSTAPATKQVEIFGQKIVYVEAGSPSNPKVILLHGLGGESNHWAMNVPALAEKYHIFALD